MISILNSPAKPSKILITKMQNLQKEQLKVSSDLNREKSGAH